MPRELSRQEFDAIAARVAQGAPAGLSRQEFDDLVAAEAMKASGYDAPESKTRLMASHEPESAPAPPRRELFGKRVPTLRETLGSETPSDAAFLKRAPEVGMAIGGTFGGPLGAGVGAGAGRLVKGQYDEGAHVPSAGEVAGAAGEGVLTTGLGAGARLAQVGARVAGPAIANNARGISRAVRSVSGSGLGASVALGNIPLALTSAATGIATSPGVIRGVGNLAARAGNSPGVETSANWIGRGLRTFAPGADAYRQALLEALGADPASTVP
jgi:hypothetical protein